MVQPPCYYQDNLPGEQGKVNFSVKKLDEKRGIVRKYALLQRKPEVPLAFSVSSYTQVEFLYIKYTMHNGNTRVLTESQANWLLPDC